MGQVTLTGLHRNGWCNEASQLGQVVFIQKNETKSASCELCIWLLNRWCLPQTAQCTNWTDVSCNYSNIQYTQAIVQQCVCVSFSDIRTHQELQFSVIFTSLSFVLLSLYVYEVDSESRGITGHLTFDFACNHSLSKISFMLFVTTHLHLWAVTKTI